MLGATLIWIAVGIVGFFILLWFFPSPCGFKP